MAAYGIPDEVLTDIQAVCHLRDSARCPAGGAGLPGDRRLAASLGEFVGHPAYGIDQLRQDLERFVFLLGGSDG